MKWFSDILKEFNPKQRMVVLLVLLVFTSTTMVMTSYLKTDDCRELINENIQLQDDIVQISRLIRELRNEQLTQSSYSNKMVTESYSDTFVVYSAIQPQPVPSLNFGILDEMEEVTQKYTN